MVFDAYAAYYDLLYNDKNYKEEALYVHELIKRHCSTARSILDLGCGTGKHANEFCSLGYEVEGVDISDKMINIAKANYSSSQIKFHHADIRSARLFKKFDVVGALFHVMCYQTQDADLLSVFDTASDHLNIGGLLIFDCWYGPGVVHDPPTLRTKLIENDGMAIERVAQPTVYAERNLVQVDYDVTITEKDTNAKHQIHEQHQLRYIFKNEIERMAAAKNFEVVASHQWLKFDVLHEDDRCWNAAFMLRKL